MPDYLYYCKECHRQIEITEPMHSNIPVICNYCGGVMRRRPQKQAVNWGGMKPSKGEIHPTIKDFIDDAPRRREEEHAN